MSNVQFATLTGLCSGCVVNMISRGLDDCYGNDPSTVIANGTTVVSETNRGLYLAALVPASCSVTDFERFDTSSYSGNSVNNTIRLLNYLNQTPNGTLLICINWDDVTSSALQSACPFILDTLGVDLSPIQFRGKVAFMTEIGYPEKAVASLLPAGGPCLNMTVTV